MSAATSIAIFCLEHAEVFLLHDREELDVLNEETDLPLEVIKAWHELAT